MMSQKIFAENTEKEQWNLLLRFGYPSNIKKAISKNGGQINLTNVDVDSIAGSIAQSYEYFKAAQLSSPFISPVLLYYGVTNLLFGITSIKTNTNIVVHNHGMKLQVPEGNLDKLGDIIINTSGDENGAFLRYSKLLTPNQNIPINQWKLSEIFKSIPEIKNDLEICYNDEYSHCIPIQIVQSQKENLERVKKSEIAHVNHIDFTNMVSGYNNSYLPPHPTNDYVILRKKLNSVDIGYYSLSGQKFIFIYHEKNNTKVILPVITSMFIGLYALCSLSRYYPHIWYRFIQSDSTGEKALVEKFLSVCKRYVPNLALNYFYDEQLLFTNEQQGTLDQNIPYSENEIKSMIQNELRRY